MDDAQYKKYTNQARAGIKGEAFFESMICDYSLPHHVSGPTDLGIDYICEWVCGDKPTGVLFAAQVKMLGSATPKRIGTDVKLNGLERFSINSSKTAIDDRTRNYWRGLGIPVYLFVVVFPSPSENAPGCGLDCYYERFTPALTSKSEHDKLGFYKVNDGTKFLAFANNEQRTQGFARDLFIDLMRCAYAKGSIAYVNPRTLGLNQFPEENAAFADLFLEYHDRVCATYARTKTFLEKHCCSVAGESLESKTRRT